MTLNSFFVSEKDKKKYYSLMELNAAMTSASEYLKTNSSDAFTSFIGEPGTDLAFRNVLA